MGMLYGGHNLPVEMQVRVRPAQRDDMSLHVAEMVADVCAQHDIREEMLRDVSLEILQDGEDNDGSYTLVLVRFYYH